jgi:hypothetical protein
MLTCDLPVRGKIEVIARDGAPIDSLLELLGVQIEAVKSNESIELNGKRVRYVKCVCSTKNE